MFEESIKQFDKDYYEFIFLYLYKKLDKFKNMRRYIFVLNTLELCIFDDIYVNDDEGLRRNLIVIYLDNNYIVYDFVERKACELVDTNLILKNIKVGDVINTKVKIVDNSYELHSDDYRIVTRDFSLMNLRKYRNENNQFVKITLSKDFNELIFINK
ncbi:MAG: hypothetical protein ACOC1P_04415 [Minisyncoccales bacterium]